MSYAPEGGGRFISHPRNDHSSGAYKWPERGAYRAVRATCCTALHATNILALVCAGAYYHAHRARFGGHLLVKGNHTPRSLGGFAPRDCFLKTMSGCGSVADARARLLAHANASGLLICHDDPAAPTYATLPKDPALGTGGSYDRPSQAVCRAHQFASREVWTSFAFSRVVFSGDIEPFMQHMGLFAYYERESMLSQVANSQPEKWGGLWDFEEGSYVEGVWDAKTGAYS